MAARLAPCLFRPLHSFSTALLGRRYLARTTQVGGGPSEEDHQLDARGGLPLLPHDDGHPVDDDNDMNSHGYDSQSFPMLPVKENTFRQEMKNCQRLRNPPYVLVEGQRLIADSLAAGAKLRTLLFTHRHLLKELPFQAQARIFFVHSRLLQKWSDVRTPSGLFALIYTPKAEDMQLVNTDSQLSLICDQVRDPTNLGVMIRTAAAFGLRRVIVVKNSVNVWSPKVIRGGMSAHFRVPIFCDVPWAGVDALLDDDTQVHVAAPWRSEAGRQNTAYHEVDFATFRRPQALVVGGETAGLSSSALAIAARTDGRRLEIPMRGGMESLNVATAGAILLSEMCRQLDPMRDATAAFQQT